jgi:hypothetical protein
VRVKKDFLLLEEHSLSVRNQLDGSLEYAFKECLLSALYLTIRSYRSSVYYLSYALFALRNGSGTAWSSYCTPGAL